MKHLKNYKLFLEADVTIPIQETDPVDIKMNKQSIENLNKQLTEYKTKRPLIDNLYKSIKDSTQLERELVRILGDQAAPRPIVTLLGSWTIVLVRFYHQKYNYIFQRKLLIIYPKYWKTILPYAKLLMT